MSPLLRQGSPHTPRIMSQLAKQQIQSQLFQNQQPYHQQQQQETSFITPAETDAAVAKINTMFPTASDTHIRLLLKKYVKLLHHFNTLQVFNFHLSLNIH